MIRSKTVVLERAPVAALDEHWRVLILVATIFPSMVREALVTEPTDEKGLRAKCSIMANLWLLAQMRQPGRAIYKDFDRNTFADILNKLLDRGNNFCKEVDDSALISQQWSYCPSNELELRKEAIRLCKERSTGIKAALWTGRVESVNSVGGSSCSFEVAEATPTGKNPARDHRAVVPCTSSFASPNRLHQKIRPRGTREAAKASSRKETGTWVT